MPVTAQPKFGTFDYEASECDVEEWRDDPGYQSGNVSIPRSDIAREGVQSLRPRIVNIKGIIGPEGGGERQDFRDAVDAFMWAHRPGVRALYKDSDRYLNGCVQSLTMGEDTGLPWCKFDVRFECPDPYYYAVTPAGPDTWTGPLTGATRTIANAGSATALPKFTITVGATGTLTLTLKNNALTEEDDFTITSLAVVSGQVLVVDCAAETVVYNGVNKMSVFTGDFFVLNPGNNQLLLTLSGVALTSIVTTFTERWL